MRKTTTLELTGEIAAAYLGHNKIHPDKLPQFLQDVYNSVEGLGQSTQSKAPRKPQEAEPLLACHECGRKYARLAKHIRVAHGLTQEEYRKKWNLPEDYELFISKPRVGAAPKDKTNTLH